jgi:hypothetical protein
MSLEPQSTEVQSAVYSFEGHRFRRWLGVVQLRMCLLPMGVGRVTRVALKIQHTARSAWNGAMARPSIIPEFYTNADYYAWPESFRGGLIGAEFHDMTPAPSSMYQSIAGLL